MGLTSDKFDRERGAHSRSAARREVGVPMAGRFTLHGIRPRLRQWAVAVVSLWTLAFVANVLAPCCEAVAASLPHSHVSVPVQHPGHSHGGASASGHDHPVSSGDHRHCPSLDKVDNGLLDNLVHAVEHQTAALATPARLVAYGALPGGLTASHVPSTLQQTGPPVYLATQRFRI